MNWQPIATAPTDHTVLLYCPQQGVVVGWFDYDNFAAKPRPYWTNYRENLHGKLATRKDQPTHWMELPQPPQNSECRP